MVVDSEFLASVPSNARKLIQTHLIRVRLEKGATVAQPHSKLETAYFPVSCVLSVDLQMKRGVTFCTGFVGCDGVLGAGMSLDDRVCLYRVSAIVDGDAFAISMSRLKDLLLELPEFRKRALAYEQFFLSQVQQTAACSAMHQMPGRLGALLLRLQRYAGDVVALTQNELAEMLAVRRTTVTEGALALQKLGAIDYRRGQIRFTDAARMISCGCDKEIASHYDRLFEEKFDGN